MEVQYDGKNKLICNPDVYFTLHLPHFLACMAVLAVSISSVHLSVRRSICLCLSAFPCVCLCVCTSSVWWYTLLVCLACDRCVWLQLIAIEMHVNISAFCCFLEQSDFY